MVSNVKRLWAMGYGQVGMDIRDDGVDHRRLFRMTVADAGHAS
jgi:hypothetical protein